MTIHITTTKLIGPISEEQQAEIFPILRKLFEAGLRGLYYNRDEQGRLVIFIDDDNFQRTNMATTTTNSEESKSRFNNYFKDTDCQIENVNLLCAFVHRGSVSFVSLLEKAITTFSSDARTSSTADISSANTSLMGIKLKRLQYLQAMKPSEKKDSFGFSHNSGFHGINSKKEKKKHKDPFRVKDSFSYFDKKESKKERHIKLESALIELLGNNDIQIPLSQIPAPNEIVLSEVTDQNDVGVSILFIATAKITEQKGEDDAKAIESVLREAISKVTETAARMGVNINFNINAFRNLASFSITFPGLDISEGSAPYFINDVKKALYATATENSYKIASITSKTVPTPEQRAARTATPQRSEIPLNQARSHTGSPISSAGDAHQGLSNFANQLITAGNCKKGFEFFMTSLNAKNYGQALRRLATSDHEVALQIATEMLRFQSQLNFTINARANENSPTALHLAAERGNEAMYNLLVENGADQTLVTNGQTAAQMLEAAKAQVASTAQLSR